MATIPQQRFVLDHEHETSVLQGNTEFELLLACCAGLQPHCQKKLKHLLTRQHDFVALLNLAREHRVIPHAYRFFNAYPELLSSGDLAMLRHSYEENTRRALRLTGELLRLLRNFEAHGIKAIPYKGPVLAKTLYGEVSGRQFFDLDILVSPKDVGAAKAALGQLGYFPEINLAPREQASFVASGYECSFCGPAGPHTVELKWRILPRFYSVEFDTETLFSRAKQVSLGGHSLQTLCVEDLLLVLCVHAAKHMWAQISWLCDIAELARSPEIEWQTTCERAERLGITRIVGVSLLLAQTLLGSVPPISMEEWCRKDAKIKTLNEQISRMISAGRAYDTDSAAYFNFMLQLRERWRDKVRFVMRLVWTPSMGEWSAMRVSERLSFMYRIVRLARLGKKMLGRYGSEASFVKAPSGTERSDVLIWHP